MKRLLALAAVLTLIGTAPVLASMEEIPEGTQIEGVSGASVMDFYGDFGISGDELMDAINSFTGSYVVSTVNEDGTPQVGFYIYSMVKDGEDYYLALGLAENQTRVNIERTGEAMALYAANPAPDAENQYAVAGARMNLELVTDEELASKLNTTGYDSTMFLKVTGCRSLG